MTVNCGTMGIQAQERICITLLDIDQAIPDQLMETDTQTLVKTDLGETVN